MRQLIKNLSLNGSDFILSILFTISISILITRQYGDSAFGIYSIIFAVISSLMLFDFGMSNVLVRLITGQSMVESKKSLFLASACQIFIIVFSISYLIVILLFDLSDFIKVSQEKYQIIVFLIFVNVLCGVFCNIYSSYYISNEQWKKIWNINQFYKACVLLGLLFIVSYYEDFDVFKIVFVFSIAAVFKAAKLYYDLNKKISFSHIFNVNNEYREIINLSKHTALNFASGFAVNHADKFLLASILTPKQFGYYAFTNQLSNSLYNGVNIIPKTIYPRSVVLKELKGSVIKLNFQLLLISMLVLVFISIFIFNIWPLISGFFYTVSFSQGVSEILFWALFFMVTRSIESVSFYYSLLVKKPYFFSYATFFLAMIIVLYIYMFINSDSYVDIFIVKSIFTFSFYSLVFLLCKNEDLRS